MSLCRLALSQLKMHVLYSWLPGSPKRDFKIFIFKLYRCYYEMAASRSINNR